MVSSVAASIGESDAEEGGNLRTFSTDAGVGESK